MVDWAPEENNLQVVTEKAKRGISSVANIVHHALPNLTDISPTCVEFS
jgi:hypothetical protein